MKKKWSYILAAGMALVSGVLLVPSTRSMPETPVAFAFCLRTNVNADVVCVVTVSNTTGSQLLYPGGYHQAWFKVRSKTADGWRESNVVTPGGGMASIDPHKAITSAFVVQDATSTIQVGLNLTSLTWRGRLGWKLSSCPLQRVLGPFVGRLLHHDEDARSRTIWSQESNLFESGTGTNDAGGPGT